jgi:glycerophosphoryl diester phosphodiesterase
MTRPLPLLALAGLLLPSPLIAAERPTPLPVGHRGMVQSYPENTLPSFEACLRAGVGFELDVRRTRDGRLVALHDETLDRTTNGKGKVADVPFAELRKLDAGAKYDARFAGTLVPELAEVFRLLGRHRRPGVVVCIDLKTADGNVEAEVVKLAKEAGVLDRLLFIGTAVGDAAVRKRLRAADPAAHVGCLADKPGDLAAALDDRHSDWAYVRFLPPAEQMRAIRAVRKRVIVVGPLVLKKEPANWEKAAAAGVDAVLTDYPAELRDALRPKE